MQVTVDDLLRIIGRKELEIDQLRRIIDAMKAEEVPAKPKAKDAK